MKLLFSNVYPLASNIDVRDGSMGHVGIKCRVGERGGTNVEDVCSNVHDKW